MEFKSGLHTPRCTPTEAALESVWRSPPDGSRREFSARVTAGMARRSPQKASLRADTAAPRAEAKRSPRGWGVSAARATELSLCIARFFDSAMLAETGNRVSCPGPGHRNGCDSFCRLRASGSLALRNPNELRKTCVVGNPNSACLPRNLVGSVFNPWKYIFP